MFNTLDLNKNYLCLCEARYSEVADLIKAYDGENTHLLDFYTLATEKTGECVYATVEQLADKVEEIEIVDIIAVHSGMAETRCYARQAQVLVLEDGSKWLDSELETAIFC
jgi:hypothetical protein